MPALCTALTGLLRRLTTNPALRYTALNQLVRLALGPVVLVALPVFLSTDELGFWYAMTGVAAILAFADMGISTAVMQFSAHEHARQIEFGALMEEGASQQDALLVFALRRIGYICLIGLPVVLAIGLWTMGRNADRSGIHWILPWTLFCFASAMALMQSVLMAFCEGQDAVSPMQRLRAGMALVTLMLTIGGTAGGFGLWTLPVASGAATVFGFVLLARSHLPGWTRLRGVAPDAVRSWATTISPLLNRYGLSWVAGYLMFQLFAPITIYLQGPALAGRVGLTVSIFTSIFTLANVWSLFRLPMLSMAVAQRDGPRLRRVFLTGTSAAFVTYVLLASGVFVVYWLTRDIPQVSRRILDPLSITFLAIGWGIQILVHNAAQFLRAFKEDPLVVPTWLSAIHTVIGTVMLLHLGHTTLSFAAFATSYIWTMPAVVRLCRQRLRDLDNWPVLS